MQATDNFNFNTSIFIFLVIKDSNVSQVQGVGNVVNVYSKRSSSVDAVFLINNIQVVQIMG